MDICPNYKPRVCENLLKAPYVCNGCGKRTNCLMEKKIYSSKYADDCYRNTLSSSREGINQTQESIQQMNDILSPLIKKGQSIAHIYATHAEELHCSRRTVYEYINAGIFDVKNIDLRRKVRYKKRKKSTGLIVELTSTTKLCEISLKNLIYFVKQLTESGLILYN